MKRKKLCGMTSEEVASELRSEGIDSSISLILTNSVYRKRIEDIAEIDAISKAIRFKLSERFETGLFKPSHISVSADRTEKYLYITSDGRRFETVYIPDIRRKTLCVSSQAGCRMCCSFCITGKSGFLGNLSAGEIVNQIITNPHAHEITKVVFMGMGEPFDNLQEVLKACEIMTAQWGLALGAGNITVSTVGINSRLNEFLEKSGCNLTLSLHSPFPEERAGVIPSEKNSPILEIIEMLKNNPEGKRRISVAYIMAVGINDTDLHLEELTKILSGTAIRVNLIPFNETPFTSWKSSSDDRMMFFKHRLVTSGISASIRKPRGNDIKAACGQLAGTV